MKYCLTALTLLSVAICCGSSDADLLDRMLGRGGCDECQSQTSCCDTPAPACGVSSGIGRPCRLFRGCGGAWAVDSCGSCSTGCCGQGHGWFAGLFGGGCGCGSGCGQSDSCGTLAETCSCGCDDTPKGDCGTKYDWRGRPRAGLFSHVGSLGCGSCGSQTTCNCDTGCGSEGLFASAFSRGRRCGCGASAGCGCDSAPVASACGCEDASGCGCGRTTRVRTRSNCHCGQSSCDGGCQPSFLDRLRSRSNPCDRCGIPYPNSGCANCGSGCGSSMPMAVPAYTPTMAPTDAAPAGEGEITAPPADNSVAPLIEAPVPPAPNQEPVPATIPPAPTPGETKSVLPQDNQGATNRIRAIDPSAFVIGG